MVDATRHAHLDRLRQGDVAVTALAAGVKMSRPAVSQHLRVMRDARLVREHRVKSGRQRIYQLTRARLREMAEWVEAYQAFWQANVANLERHRKGDVPEFPVEETHR